MTQQTRAIRYLPSRLSVGVAVGGMILAWLVVLGGLAGTVVFLSRLGFVAVLPLALMCGGTGPAISATRRVLLLRRIRAKVPARLLRQRRHGDLTEITNDQNRPLRPVGTTVADVVTRTDALLGPLTALPGVQIFEGVRLPGVSRPAASHAVSAGRLVVLVESVAWPPGQYRMDATGRVRCDGQYIGQTVRSLSAAIRAYRALLPRTHQVCALITVYRAADGDYVLPSGTKDLRWILADDLLRDLHTLLTPHLSTVSRHTIAALTEGHLSSRGAA
jgi:hypothetical protein